MIIALVRTVDIIFQAYTFLIFARIISSWIRIDPYHPFWGPILRFVYQATQPIMEPVRRLMPAMGGLDFSPIVVLLGLNLLRRLVLQVLIGFA